MSKGKSHNRVGRGDLMRSNARSAARRARQQARKGYEQQAYDKPASEET
jgi:hypothetical protein